MAVSASNVPEFPVLCIAQLYLHAHHTSAAICAFDFMTRLCFMCRWVYYMLLQKPQRRTPGSEWSVDSVSTSSDYSLDSEAAAFLPQAVAPTANS